MRYFLIASIILLGFSCPAQAAVAPPPIPQAASSQDADGNIQFTFGGASSVKVAPVGNVAGGAACSVTSEGAIRYNSTLKSFEGCDGVRWRAFSDFDTRQWQNVTASRSFNTAYTNNTGQAIEVSLMTYSGCATPGINSCNPAFFNPAPVHCAASVSVNSLAAPAVFVPAAYQFSNGLGVTHMCNAKAVVPAGAQYILNNDGWPDVFMYVTAELR